MIGKCTYCKKENKDLRPYGENGNFICFECGMKPENKKETEKQFHDIIKDKDIIVFIDGINLH